MAYIKRAAEDTIARVSKMFPVLLVTGPRQVGKTTLLQRLADIQKSEGIERKYVTLDDPDVRYLAKHDPALFLQRYSPPVLIDEIQYATELLPYIKMSVDRSKRKGDFWITGSQVFRLMKNVSESLAGRVGIINLLGLSDAEIYQEPSEPFQTDAEQLMNRLSVRSKKDLNEIYRRIFKGSMPELYADEYVDWETYYRSYVDTYLQRDIRDLAQVADEMQFYNFMTIVAAQTSKPVVYEELASAAGISAPTAKKWLSILVSSHIIALVQPYHNNALKRVVKMPLIHFLDTGLAAYLTRWNTVDVLMNGAMAGAFFETFVISEIIKSYYNAGVLDLPLYFYRDKEQNEIDLIIWQNGMLHPVEIKKHADPNKNDVKAFAQLDKLKDLKRGTGCVICMYDRFTTLERDVMVAPISFI